MILLNTPLGNFAVLLLQYIVLTFVVILILWRIAVLFRGGKPTLNPFQKDFYRYLIAIWWFAKAGLIRFKIYDINSGYLEKRIKYLDKTIAAYPMPEVLALRAELYPLENYKKSPEKGKFGISVSYWEAVELLDKAIALDPENETWYIQRAWASDWETLRKDIPSEEVRIFFKAEFEKWINKGFTKINLPLEQYRKNRDVHAAFRERSFLNIEKRNLDKAIEDIRAYHSFGYNNCNGHYARLLLLKGDHEEAIKVMEHPLLKHSINEKKVVHEIVRITIQVKSELEKLKLPVPEKFGFKEFSDHFQLYCEGHHQQGTLRLKDYLFHLKREYESEYLIYYSNAMKGEFVI